MPSPFHMSGDAGYLESCDREYEEQPHVVVDHDGGSSAWVLETWLQKMYLRALML